MALGPKLDLRQSQSLVMTPQLQQAIKLLQMSNLELNTYVEQELEQNPLLEFDETDGGLDSPADAPDGETRDASAGEDGATGDGSSDPLEQAAPAAAHTPRSLSPSRIASASRPANARLLVFHNRVAPPLLTVTPVSCWVIVCSK